MEVIPTFAPMRLPCLGESKSLVEDDLLPPTLLWPLDSLKDLRIKVYVCIKIKLVKSTCRRNKEYLFFFHHLLDEEAPLTLQQD